MLQQDYSPVLSESQRLLKEARTEEHPNGYTPDLQGALLFRKEFDEVTQKIILEGIPCAENLQFTFAIENLPIFAREQMVRHRIGVKFDDRLGVDIIPDLADSSWWSQTMRVIDMGSFYEDGQWFEPESVSSHRGILLRCSNPDHMFGCSCGGTTSYAQAQEIYRMHIQNSQEAYNDLVKLGIPREDARNVLPMAMSHRLTWNLNLSALKHIIGKRTCWIAQFGVWEQIVSGMVQELVKVDPVFGKIVNPPCIKGDTWVSCPFNHTNVTRVQGSDPFPPCPLWLTHNSREARNTVLNYQEENDRDSCWVPLDMLHPHRPELGDAERVYPPQDSDRPGGFPGSPAGWVTLSQKEAAQMEEGREVFCRFWNRDVDTGEPLS
jgi:hypothetical protein